MYLDLIDEQLAALHHVRRGVAAPADPRHANMKRNSLQTLFRQPVDILHSGNWDSVRISD